MSDWEQQDPEPFTIDTLRQTIEDFRDSYKRRPDPVVLSKKMREQLQGKPTIPASEKEMKRQKNAWRDLTSDHRRAQ